ncbi:SDR family oxidoreductase [Candidatus Pelagibacter bacterium nBUS_44]|uniref:SDR family oxidoreductase n=1 Tax=Candidatus Pelagibacter bacterium nBUS_44 TaxID=3374195 RepID=UPI003EBE3B6C
MRTILISGGKGKLGTYLINKFLKNNYYVINLSRNINSSKQNNLENIKCDLNKPKEIEQILKKIKKKHKILDSIVSCAGKSKKSYKSTESKKDFLLSFDQNFFSFTNLLENYLKIFKKKEIKIIVFSSIVASKITEAPLPYSISKNALNYYCKIKAKELAKHKIKINIISPGNILMKNNNWMKKIKKNPGSVKKYIKDNVPLNCFCNPGQLFDLCAYLLSTSGDSVTGSNFIIDGGESLK